MINILIIEDGYLHFEIIHEAINKKLSHVVEIFPKNILDIDHNLSDQNYLIDYIQQKRFKEVIDFYNYIDLFIIDATLTPGSDKLGVEFLNYLQKNYIKKFNAILISNTDEMGNLIDSRAFFFISKVKHSMEDAFPIELIRTVQGVYKIGPIDALPKSSLKELFINRIQLYGWKHSLHILWNFINKNIQRRIIDKMILLLLYAIISVTAIYAGWNIFYAMYVAFKDSSDEAMMLKVAEKIFLNLLPTFIVFGFLNYYKRNIRIFLLEGNTFSVDEDISAKPMNLTKILFTSSIISYAIIKIIEEIFTNSSISLLRLCSFGALLIILMTYFIYLNKIKH